MKRGWGKGWEEGVEWEEGGLVGESDKEGTVEGG
jgi:hypothetical protein